MTTLQKIVTCIKMSFYSITSYWQSPSIRMYGGEGGGGGQGALVLRLPPVPMPIYVQMVMWELPSYKGCVIISYTICLCVLLCYYLIHSKLKTHIIIHNMHINTRVLAKG